MLKILKRPTALKDIKSIWTYSYKKWGETQANQYLQGLDLSVMALAEKPLLGRSINNVRVGYRQHRYRHHFIIYRHSDETLEIFRVLHERMDIARHKF